MSTKPCQNPCDLKSIPSYLSFSHIHRQAADRETKKITTFLLHPQNYFRNMPSHIFKGIYSQTK